MKCWGANTTGQLGDNSTTQRLTPVNVSGLTSGVVAITAGQSHTCAVTTRRRRQVLGLNANGQLGDNSITTAPDTGHRRRESPAARLQWRRATCHTCALVSGGVKCWGLNANGQLGDNTQTQRLTPVDVVGLASGVTAIADGLLAHLRAAHRDGHAVLGRQHACGSSATARSVGQRLTPVDVIGPDQRRHADHGRQPAHVRADRRAVR